MPPPTRRFPRFLAPRLREALADTPVLLIHGPRQSGKTTLAQDVGGRRGYRYYSFDDDVARAAAEADPAGFVAELPDRVILDEVQRVPALFTALKIAVDRRRVPGRFILTGSSNVLLVPKLADSLAGRMGLLRLYPLAQCELAGKPSRFLDVLFAGGFKTRTSKRLGVALAQRIVSGGYPAALLRQGAARRSAWYRDYVETQVQRDVRDLGRIRALDALPRLLAVAAGCTAQLINVSDLAGPFQLARQTIHDYVTLLERVFLLERLPPWHSNRMSRLVKTPKLHIGDTGVACALLGHDAEQLHADRSALGPLLETFVLQDLKRQASRHGSILVSGEERVALAYLENVGGSAHSGSAHAGAAQPRPSCRGAGGHLRQHAGYGVLRSTTRYVPRSRRSRSVCMSRRPSAIR